ncbi:MAG: type II secretion system protein [Candidatus Paceibacterota bacterium]
MNKKFKQTVIYKSGFSLIELLVVLGIFIVLTSLTIYKYSQFNSNLTVTNLAYEIALTAREAQVYGLGVKNVNPSLSSFQIGYGVSFSKNTTSLVPGQASSFILFADVNKNGKYESGTDSLIDTFTLREGVVISDLCASYGVAPNKTLKCFSDGSIDTVDTTFIRPEPSANISERLGVGSEQCPTRLVSGGNVLPNCSGTVIDISSVKGKHKCIVISSTGQISVQEPVSSCSDLL